MNISDEYEQCLIAKQKRDELDKLYRKLMGFAKRQFKKHYFRGEAGGIPPSGDGYEDFVIRAFIHCCPRNGKFKIDQNLEWALINYIRRQISRESKLKINILVKNETYYENRNYIYNPVQMAVEKSKNVRQAMIEEQRKKIYKEIVQRFINSVKEDSLKGIIKELSADYINFEQLIRRIIDDSSGVIKELIKKGLIYDVNGQITDKMKNLNRPCKMTVNYRFPDKKVKRYLFGILKMDRRLKKPQFAAFYLGIPKEEYDQLIRKLRRKFIEFFCEWNKGINAELLKELGIFQGSQFKKSHKYVD